jgi:hypothetical protein
VATQKEVYKCPISAADLTSPIYSRFPSTSLACSSSVLIESYLSSINSKKCKHHFSNAIFTFLGSFAKACPVPGLPLKLLVSKTQQIDHLMVTLLSFSFIGCRAVLHKNDLERDQNLEKTVARSQRQGLLSQTADQGYEAVAE